MKCTRCGGSGKYMREVGGYRPCEYCDGTGEIVQTNEEWLRNLSFNELARVLYCMIINGERIRPDLAYIKRWLKQPHTESSSNP